MGDSLAQESKFCWASGLVWLGKRERGGVSEPEEYYWEYLEALKPFKKEAEELTQEELNQALLRYDYDLRLSRIAFEHATKPSQDLVKRGAEIIELIGEAFTDCMEPLRRGKIERAVPAYQLQRALPRALALRTVFDYTSYTVDEKSGKVPASSDDFQEWDDYHQTEEYELRNGMLEAFMAYLIVGARVAKTYGEIFMVNWITAIRLLYDATNQRSGQGMEEDKADKICASYVAGLRDLKLAVHLGRKCDSSATPEQINTPFYVAEDDNFGITSKRVGIEDNSIEGWARQHNGQVIGERFFLSYTADEGLSLRDVIRCPNPDGKNYNYPKLARYKTHGKVNVKFKALIAILKQFERAPEKPCQSPPDENWSGAFQSGAGETAQLVYRFVQEQMRPRLDKEGKLANRWMFLTVAEVKRIARKCKHVRKSRKRI